MQNSHSAPFVKQLRLCYIERNEDHWSIRQNV